MITKLLIGILAFALIVILFKCFYEIRILLIKITHGKYSYRYMASYKKRYKKSPFPYCMKDEAIHKIIIFFDNDEKNENFKTIQKIKFGDINYGEDFSKLKKSKKKPHCFNAEILPGNIELKVFGYNENLFDMHMKALYYFLDNKFFMGEYVFKDIRPENISKITEIIKEKYKIEEKINTSRFVISDQINNKLHFFDTGFSLQIKYFTSEDEDIIITLEKYIDNFKPLIETRKEESINTIKERL